MIMIGYNNALMTRMMIMMINDHDDSDDKDHDISECMPLSHFQYEIGH